MTSRAVAELIPPPVLDSPLMKKGGYEVFDGFPDEGTFERMQAEALRLFPAAYPSDVKGSAARGFVTRGQLRATGAGVQQAFYHRRRTLRFVREVSGLPMVPTGASGGYLYYARPGDHVALHRDGEGCELVMLTCLSDTPGLRSDGGVLYLYPERIFERAERIQATPDQGAVKLRLRPGQTIMLLGGFVAHALSPVSSGQTRIVSSLCYRLDLHDRNQRAATARRTAPRGRT